MFSSLAFRAVVPFAAASFLLAGCSGGSTDAGPSGVPDKVEKEFGTSPLTAEGTGSTKAEIAAVAKRCATVAPQGSSETARQYAAILTSLTPDEVLLSADLRSQESSTPAQRKEQVRLDGKKIAAIKANPELAVLAAEFVTAVQAYDAVLAKSADASSWERNAPEARAHDAERAAAASALRGKLGLPSSPCPIKRP